MDRWSGPVMYPMAVIGEKRGWRLGIVRRPIKAIWTTPDISTPMNLPRNTPNSIPSRPMYITAAANPLRV